MLEAAKQRYARIPQAMRDLPQWCIAGPDKSPYTITAHGVHSASNRDPKDWLTFDKALEGMVATNAPAIGFVCTDEAGITCIDLDVKNAVNYPDKPHEWTKPEQLARQVKIVEVFNTYTERSISGQGVHLWLYGSIGAGAKRDGVEVYSRERFMVCTGDAFIDVPMVRNDDMLALLVEEVRKSAPERNYQLVEIEETQTDEEVYNMASNAVNADKFSKLMQGDWQGDYPSQSEADLALMSMFTFYSKSNAQCRRLFRYSGLGQRAKATKNDRYLNFTLEIIRCRQEREAIVDERTEEMARNLVRQLQSSTPADVMAAQIVNAQPLPQATSEGLDWPPGIAGQIAAYIYNGSYRPIKEVSIVAALGFLAGVCGRAYNYSNTGLNLYMILIAQSGVGKEAMHTGISNLLEVLREISPAAQGFADFTEFASGQALVKACSIANSFVNVSGEWGRRLQRMGSDERPDSPMSTLRTVMTNLYQKSGRGMMAGGIGYSNTDQNMSMDTGVAYSLIGESTPDTFYQALTASMMEDGFMSRFIVVKYTGMRQPANVNMTKEMSPQLKQSLGALCAQAIANNSRHHAEEVQATPEAKAKLAEFDVVCDNHINGSQDESIRQMWNRAHLKVVRMSALLAVGDNWIAPVIQLAHVQWALDVVMRDITSMKQNIEQGDVGQSDDTSRYNKFEQVVREYFQADANSFGPSYFFKKEMRDSGIIPAKYLHQKLLGLASFRKARAGSNRALKDVLDLAVKSGMLVGVPRDKMVAEYGYAGDCYRIAYKF